MVVRPAVLHFFDWMQLICRVIQWWPGHKSFQISLVLPATLEIVSTHFVFCLVKGFDWLGAAKGWGLKAEEVVCRFSKISILARDLHRPAGSRVWSVSVSGLNHFCLWGKENLWSRLISHPILLFFFWSKTHNGCLKAENRILSR